MSIKTVKNLNLIFTSIINGYIRNKKIIKVKNSNFFFIILKILYREGYIFGFYNSYLIEKNKNNSQLIIELKYSLKGYNFINIYKNSYICKNKKIISYLQLKKNYRFARAYILTTSKGIINGLDALSFKTGGILLFKLN